MFLEDNKIPLSMLKLSFLDKAKFTGSYKDKRYMFEAEFITINKEVIKKDGTKEIKEEKKPDKLLLHIYPDKYCYEKTDKKDIETFVYSYDNDGIKEGLDYLSKIFDEK